MKDENSKTSVGEQVGLMPVPDEVWTKWLQIMTRYAITRESLAEKVKRSVPTVRQALTGQIASKATQLAITEYLSGVINATDEDLKNQLTTLQS